MRKLTHIVNTKTINGKPANLVRNYFVYDESINWLKKAQSYYTKLEKKTAKQLYKLNSKKHYEG